MKTTVAGILFIAVCLFFYNRQHPFGRPAIPDGHDYAADGVYFLRTGYTVPDPAGPVQWKSGQQVFEDRLAKTTAPDGMRLVTAGPHSLPIPTNMLSEDVQEGQALREAEVAAQNRLQAQAQSEAQAQAQRVAKAEQERLRAEQERLRAEAQAKAEADRLRAAQARQPSPTPMFGHTALDQPTQIKPARYYNGRYYYYPTPTP